MKKTIKLISILFTLTMLTGLMTSVAFAASLPSNFGWSSTNPGYITIDVPAFDEEEVEYFLDLYKDGNLVNHSFGVCFDESRIFECEIFTKTIKELGNGTYKYKIGFERDFDTDALINPSPFSSEYTVTSYSHSVAVENNTENINNPVNTVPENTVNTPIPESTPPQPAQAEDNSPKTVIKGRLTYPKDVTKPLQTASVYLYKKNGIGNTRPLITTSTDANGNFEISYKQGQYDLYFVYGESDMTVTVDANTELKDLGNIEFKTYEYTFNGGYTIIIPHNVTTIDISQDNLNDYFEDIQITSEYEENANNFSTNYSYRTDNVCGFTSSMAGHKTCALGEAFASFDEKNLLWLISSRSMPGFKYSQANAIYDEINNVLYYVGLGGWSSGMVVSDFSDNGTVTLTKFETIVFGNPTIYKITEMTARFKKLPYVTVSYNNELIAFDQKPVIENGRTLVPLRAIFEKIGADVEWHGDTQTVVATKGDTSISLTINNTTATKNGTPIILDVPAKIINDRTMVPVRFVADCFGVDVQWNGEIQRVVLTK